MDYQRNRVLYASLIVIVICLGLGSRKMSYALPDFLNVYIGDALWSLMIFIGFGFVFKSFKTRNIVLISFIFCYCIEISQLYQAEWINHIRATTLGGLILGYGFLWSDLLAYAIGIGIGVLFELLYQKIKNKKRSG